MTKRGLCRWELAGFFFICGAGSMLHFVFAWTGGWVPAAWLAAVNESTWEHLKMGFWPGLLFALVEYGAFGRGVNNFWLAKTLGLFTIPVAIIALFYGYTALAGRNYLAADISVFFAAAAFGQAVSYGVLKAPAGGQAARRIALGALVALTAAFALLTYFPPKVFLFEDPRTQECGIHSEDM